MKKRLKVIKLGFIFLALVTASILISQQVFMESEAKGRPRIFAKPSPKPTASPTPAPTIGPIGQITKKVLVLNFDPLINGTTPLHTYKGWNDPITLQNQYIIDVKNASHQYVNYQIVNTQTIRDYPVKMSGFKFTQTQYLGCFTDSSPTYCMEGIDYAKLVADYNLCNQISSGAIDEVFIWGGPFFGYQEWTHIGPDAPPYITQDAVCSKRFPIMGFNYERGVIEMIHNLAHKVESIMTNIYGGSYPYDYKVNFGNTWGRYWLFDKLVSGKAACGDVHDPPNDSVIGNDRRVDLQTYVNSTCKDWLNYPSTTGVKELINCSAWGCTEFEKYWLSHIPSVTGISNGKLNNWWSYAIDYDNAIAKAPNEKEKWYVVESGVNDSYSSCGQTITSSNEVYFGVNPGCSTNNFHKPKFMFPNVVIPKNTVITDAYLEVVTDGTFTNPITENITLTDGTTTTLPVTWPISSTWNSQTIVKSPNLQSIVQQLVNSASWSSGKTITLSATHVGGSGERRVFAFEREAMAGARLVIKTNGILTTTPTPTVTPTRSPSPTPVSTPTKSPTPTPKPTATPPITPNICFNFKDLSGNIYLPKDPIVTIPNKLIKLIPQYINTGSVPSSTFWNIPDTSKLNLTMSLGFNSYSQNDTKTPYNLEASILTKARTAVGSYANVKVTAYRNGVEICSDTLKFVIN